MSTLTIEQADYFQAATGNLKNEDKAKKKIQDTQEEKKTVDYTDFFAKNPHYREYQREHLNRLRQFTANLTRTQNLPVIGRGEKFISHDGNSILTVKGNKISATNKNGEPDIKAMLDLAEAHGWQSIRLPKMLGKGSRAYRQELWLEAKRRGIEVENYKPTQAEEQKLAGILAKEQDNQALKIVPTKEVSGSLNVDSERQPEKSLTQETLSGSLNEKGKETDNALKEHSLSQAEAHKALMGVISEFFPHDSPNYKDAEVKLDHCLAEIYGKGKSLKSSHIKYTRNDYANKMPAMRERYYQATQNEQGKVRVTEQQNIHQHKQHSMELGR
ncbi:MAG: hypothetical protein IJ881_08125 [Neisseriaceae bacterium]|nr:hypothetical protein [Neisseriaceae bacterium]MBR3425283.1 hypothetical protein [Neisseriaceae bacterium]